MTYQYFHIPSEVDGMFRPAAGVLTARSFSTMGDGFRFHVEHLLLAFEARRVAQTYHRFYNLDRRMGESRTLVDIFWSYSSIFSAYPRHESAVLEGWTHLYPRTSTGLVGWYR